MLNRAKLVGVGNVGREPGIAIYTLYNPSTNRLEFQTVYYGVRKEFSVINLAFKNTAYDNGGYLLAWSDFLNGTAVFLFASLVSAPKVKELSQTIVEKLLQQPYTILIAVQRSQTCFQCKHYGFDNLSSSLNC